LLDFYLYILLFLNGKCFRMCLKIIVTYLWRRMIKVPWTEHKTNEEILHMVETERDNGHR